MPKPPFPPMPAQEPAGAPVTMDEVKKKKEKIEADLQQKELDFITALQKQTKYEESHYYHNTQPENRNFERWLVPANKTIEENATASTAKFQEFVDKQAEEKKLADEIKVLITKKEANEKEQKTRLDQLAILNQSQNKTRITIAKKQLLEIERKVVEINNTLDTKSPKERDELDKELKKLDLEKQYNENLLKGFGNAETLQEELDAFRKTYMGADDAKSKKDSIIQQLQDKETTLNTVQNFLSKDEEVRKANLIKLQKAKDEHTKLHNDVSKLITQRQKNKEVLDRLGAEADLIADLSADELETELPKIHTETTKLLKDEKGVLIPDYKDLYDEIEALHKKRTQFLEGPTQSSVVAEHFDSLSLKAHGTDFQIKGNNPEKTKELQKNLDRKIDEVNRTGSVIVDGVEVIRTTHGFQAKESGLKGAMLALDMTIGRSNPDEAELIVSGGKSITCNNAAALLALGHGVKSLKFGTPPSLNADSTLIERIFEINSELPSAKSYEMVGESKFAALIKEFNKEGQPTADLTRLTLSALNADNIKKIMNTAGLPYNIINEQLPFAMIAKLQRSSNSQATLSEIHTIFNNLDSNGKKVFLEKLHGKFNSMSVFTRRGSVYYNFFKKVIEDFKTKKDNYKDFYESVPKEKGADSLKNWIKECGGEPPHSRNEEHELMDGRNNGVRH